MPDRKQTGRGDEAPHKRTAAPEDWSRAGRREEQEIKELDQILEGISFPAGKESLAARLAVEAFSHGGGRAAELHDLVVQLEDRTFRNLDELHRAIRERHAWERTHAPADIAG